MFSSRTMIFSYFAVSLALPVADKITENPQFVMVMNGVQQTVKPQTAEQSSRGEQYGRNVSFIELLQPSLDPKLESYTKTNQLLTGNLTLAASDVLADLSQKWVEAFTKIYPTVSIHIPAPYAGSLRANELINGSIQGVFVARELRPTDITGFKDAYGYPPTVIPIGGGTYRQFGFVDSMGFFVHKDNPLESLGLEQLDSIFSTTRLRGGKVVQKWKDLGVPPPLGEKDIKLYGLQPWNGFEEFIRQRVLNFNGSRGEWRDAKSDSLVTWDKTVFNISMRVANDPAGIGYTGLAYVNAPVKLLAVGNEKRSPVAPTYENIALANYPLSRVTYFTFNQKPGAARDPVLLELLKFVLSKQGQEILLGQRIYLPLRRPQQEASLSSLIH